MMEQSLSGKIALVTGATRGIGKGIALQLAQNGATVYITGRTLKSKDGLGSLEDTAREITERGGKCIPVKVDHENDSEIHDLFKKIEFDQSGRLDILVNNAYKGIDSIFDQAKQDFWETNHNLWDHVNNVGLRNHYICTVYAARLMVPRNTGLIVNISSIGGMRYLFNVPYGVGKAALDRMSADCGIELKKHNITVLSLYPGIVKTELINHLNDKNSNVPVKTQRKFNIDMKTAFSEGESIEFTGRALVKLAADPNLSYYNSKVVIAADYAQSHGITDIDGRVIPSVRQINTLFKDFILPDKLKFIANFIPNFVKIPYFVLAISSSKF